MKSDHNPEELVQRSWLRHRIYRFGHRLALSPLLIHEYGGCRIPTKLVRAFYVGRATHDWAKLAVALDRAYSAALSRVRSDFVVARSRTPKLHLAIVGHPPGVFSVAKKLELDHNLSLHPEATFEYSWEARLILLSDFPNREVFRGTCLYGFVLATCHSLLGANWDRAWCMWGYAAFASISVTNAEGTIILKTLAHLLKSLDEKRTVPLARMLSGPTSAEANLGPTAENEQRYYFVHYLYSMRETVPEAWSILAEYMKRSIKSGTEFQTRLEEALGATIAGIEARFVDWCRCQLLEAV